MLETDADLGELQRLLDVSAAGGGAHLASVFTAERRMSARDLCEALGGILEVHLAALSRGGAPLVAPVDGILFKGKLWISLPEASVRSRLIRRDARVSVSYTNGDVGLIVHGVFREVAGEEAATLGFDSLVRRLYTEAYGDWFGAWLDSKGPTNDLTGYVEPRVMFAKH